MKTILFVQLFCFALWHSTCLRLVKTLVLLLAAHVPTMIADTTIALQTYTNLLLSKVLAVIAITKQFMFLMQESPQHF
jgi:hypothetical protein